MNHTDTKYESDLNELKELITKMGERTREIIALAVESFKQDDVGLARKIMEIERETDKIELKIDEAGANLIALHQPVARDLRQIMAGMRIATDLERICDHATNIAEDVIYRVEAKVVKHGGNN